MAGLSAVSQNVRVRINKFGGCRRCRRRRRAKKKPNARKNVDAPGDYEAPSRKGVCHVPRSTATAPGRIMPRRCYRKWCVRWERVGRANTKRTHAQRSIYNCKYTPVSHAYRNCAIWMGYTIRPPVRPPVLECISYTRICVSVSAKHFG